VLSVVHLNGGQHYFLKYCCLDISCPVKLTGNKKMKKIFGLHRIYILLIVGLLILLVSYRSLAQTTWQWQNPFPQGNDLNDIHVFSSDSALAVGWTGTILKTTDGGSSWDIIQSGTKAILRSICFINNNTGWAVGDSGIVLKTTDNGDSWTRYSVGSFMYSLWSVHFIDNNYGWAVGGAGKIFKTTNGGTNWAISSFSTNNMRDVFFSDSSNGWICGSFGSILKTTNGGESWTPYFGSAIHDFYSLFFIDSLKGWACGTGAIITTTNGGLNWTNQSSYLDGNSIFFLSDSIGFVVDNGRGYAVTTNGGLIWNHEPGNARYPHLNSVHASDINSIWAVGQYGNILKSTTVFLNFQELSSGKLRELFSIFFIDPLLGWAVGGAQNPPVTNDGTTILKTTDGGINWQLIPFSLTNIALYPLFFVNENIGWTASADGVILKTVNGGYNWSPQIFVTDTAIVGMHFINENIGWAIGDRGKILKTTNGGTNWFSQTSGKVSMLWGIDFVDDQTGWIAGAQGVILKTTNGGDTWETQTASFPSMWFADVCFLDANTGWIAAGNGRLLKTTNGGSTWTDQQISTILQYYSIKFINSNLGWAVGSGGTVHRTTNGGSTWVAQERKTHYALNSVFFIDEQNGWVAGAGGNILKTNNGNTTNVALSNSQIPKDFTLSQNYPNPFNPSTTISWQSPVSGYQTIKLFDVLGREIETIVEDYFDAGLHSTLFIVNSSLPSGVYFYQICAGDFVETKKMLLLK
jgi:photosystem II stability/assembly factor-like uncharacterized protein